jgi:rubrerythrin
MKTQREYFMRAVVVLGSIFLCPGVQAKTLVTVENLEKARLIEVNAYNKYTKFAEQADKEGYPLVTKLFRSVAFSELMHSRNHGAAIEGLGGRLEPFALKAVTLGSTKENLENAAKEEQKDDIAMYAAFMLQADKDGLRDAKTSFKFASDSEQQHKQLLEKSLTLLGPKNVDYYIDVKSGETIEVKPGEAPPQSKLTDGAFIKAAN